MSRENVELVRAIYEKWERGDFSDASWADDDIEFVSPEGITMHGVADMGRSWADWLRSWDGFESEAEEYIDRDDAVLVLTTFRGRGRESGVPAAFPGAALFAIRHGKVRRLKLYLNPEDGRRGLEDDYFRNPS